MCNHDILIILSQSNYIIHGFHLFFYNYTRFVANKAQKEPQNQFVFQLKTSLQVGDSSNFTLFSGIEKHLSYRFCPWYSFFSLILIGAIVGSCPVFILKEKKEFSSCLSKKKQQHKIIKNWSCPILTPRSSITLSL